MHCTPRDVIIIIFRLLLFCSFQIFWHVSNIFQTHIHFEIILVSPILHGNGFCRIHGELNKMRYVTKKWLFDSVEWLFNRKRGTHIDEKL